jgi:hypothetical protein
MYFLTIHGACVTLLVASLQKRLQKKLQVYTISNFSEMYSVSNVFVCIARKGCTVLSLSVLTATFKGCTVIEKLHILGGSCLTLTSLDITNMSFYHQ